MHGVPHFISGATIKVRVLQYGNMLLWVYCENHKHANTGPSVGPGWEMLQRVWDGSVSRPSRRLPLCVTLWRVITSRIIGSVGGNTKRGYWGRSDSVEKTEESRTTIVPLHQRDTTGDAFAFWCRYWIQTGHIYGCWDVIRKWATVWLTSVTAFYQLKPKPVRQPCHLALLHHVYMDGRKSWWQARNRNVSIEGQNKLPKHFKASFPPCFPTRYHLNWVAHTQNHMVNSDAVHRNSYITPLEAPRMAVAATVWQECGSRIQLVLWDKYLNQFWMPSLMEGDKQPNRIPPGWITVGWAGPRPDKMTITWVCQHQPLTSCLCNQHLQSCCLWIYPHTSLFLCATHD